MTYIINFYKIHEKRNHKTKTFTVEDEILDAGTDVQSGAIYLAKKELSLNEDGDFFTVSDLNFPDEPICLVYRLSSTTWGEPHYK